MAIQGGDSVIEIEYQSRISLIKSINFRYLEPRPQMFKALILLSLVSLSLSAHVRMHRFNIEKLNDQEKKVDQFFRNNIKWLEEAQLSDGKVEDNKYTFQYLSKTVPITISQVSLDVWEDGSYHITDTMKNVELPTEAGRLAKTTKLTRVGTWADAMDKLDWD